MTSKEDANHDLCPKPPPTFVREATGLVRELSTFNIVGMNWTGEALAAGLITYFGFAFLFPNANLPLAMAITIVGFAPFSITYAMSVVAMPRSGGDYVFISRVLHPSLGFMLVLSQGVWFGYYTGAAANWIFTLGISPVLSIIGSISGDQTALGLSAALLQPTVVVVGGAVVLIISTLIGVFSTKWTARLVTITIGLGLLSVAAIGVIAAVSTNPQFQAAFNSYSASYSNSANYYATIISTATSGGLTQGATSWSDTLGMVPFAAFIFLFLSAFQCAAGEVKNPGRTAYKGSILTIFIGGAVALLATVALTNTLSQTFLNAVGFDYYSGMVTSYVLPVAPTYNFLASLLTRNIIVLWLLNVGFITTLLATFFLFYLFLPRYLLACAFDRLLPDMFAHVSERFHTPSYSILVSGAIGLIVLPIYTYYASILSALAVVLGELLFGYLLFAIAAVLFPYSKRTKRIYENSSIKQSVAGVPVITILGVFDTVFLCFIAYAMLVNSAYGVNSTYSIIAMFGTGAAAPIWYFARKFQLKRKGLDLSMVFAEIPPE